MKINGLSSFESGEKLGLVVGRLESDLDLEHGQDEGDGPLGRPALDHGHEPGGEVLAGEELDVGHQDSLGRRQGPGHVPRHVYRVGQAQTTTLGPVRRRGRSLQLRRRAVCRGSRGRGQRGRVRTRKYQVDGDLEKN